MAIHEKPVKADVKELVSMYHFSLKNQVYASKRSIWLELSTSEITWSEGIISPAFFHAILELIEREFE